MVTSQQTGIDAAMVTGKRYIATGPAGSHECDLRAHQPDFGTRAEKCDLLFQPRGQCDIVGIESGQKFRIAKLDARVQRASQSLVFLMNHADTRSFDAFQVVNRSVGRAIVDQQQRPILIGLLPHRFDRFRQPRHAVIDGNQYRDVGESALLAHVSSTLLLEYPLVEGAAATLGNHPGSNVGSRLCSSLPATE